jgi:amino acid adenylation domain-containing protein
MGGQMKDTAFQHKLNACLNQFRDHIAIECADMLITYGEIEKRSDHIANFLVEKGFGKETAIGMMINDRIDFIFTMIGILKAGCIFVPLDSLFPRNRIEVMIDTADIHDVICDTDNYDRFFKRDVVENKGIECILLDDLSSNLAYLREVKKPNIQYGSEDRIYIYFTSGSTGVPKAIVGKNKSLLHFIHWQIETFAIPAGFRMSQFTTPGFDAFLRDIFVPLCAGGVICVPQITEEIQDGDGLVNWIDRLRVNLIHCVPSLFRMLNSPKLTQKNFKDLKYILLSGERINPVDLVNWYSTFDNRIQLVNLYGPTETTMIKTYYFIQKSDINRERIPIGRPMKGARVVIFDESMKFCDELITGELYIRTFYGTFGYYNDPELNRKNFLQNPLSNDANDLLFKTGDLGRYLPDGNIELLGRIDRQVKVRGVRIELEEIENAIMKHPSVKEAVVIKDEDSDKNEILVAYVTAKYGDTVEEGLFVNRLKDYISLILPLYMVPAHMIKMRQIPRKPNGKVEYDLLPWAIQVKSRESVLPRNDVEKKLSEIWSEILGHDRIGVDENFFELGGNSLNAISLLSKIHREFDRKITVPEIFINHTIEKQARIIMGALRDIHDSIKSVEKKDYYALSSAQKRIYILEQMALEKTAYNIPQVIVLEEEPSREHLQDTFLELIDRHESLRTSFQVVQGEPVQRIHKKVDFKIAVYQGQPERPARDRHINAGDGGGDPLSLAAQQVIKDFITPFDPGRAPLLQVNLINTAESRTFMMIDMHHIISDGVSLGILVKDFMSLYAAKELPALRLQYKDYAEWQNKKRESPQIRGQEEYWVAVFEGELPVVNMPLDFARPPIQSFAGSTVRFVIEGKESDSIKRLTLEADVTLYMVFLALYNILVSKLTNQEDIVIGTPVAGRWHVDLEQIMGMFVNTLPLRNFANEDKTFIEFLLEIKGRTLEAFENQNYQFEDLVDRLAVDRDMSRNPLFDLMFTFQNFEVGVGGGLEQTLYPFVDEIAKFDLTLRGMEAGERLIFAFQFCTKLFKRETIERCVSYFKKIALSVVENPEKKISEIEVIPEAERRCLLHEFNKAGNGYPEDETLHGLFERQAHRTPESIAIVTAASGNMNYISYRRLNNRTNQLARIFIEKGVKRDCVVAIMLERSVEMIAGIVAVLKAGGAYLPLNPKFPEDRKRYMTTDCGVQLIVTEKSGRSTGHSFNKIDVIGLDLADKNLFKSDKKNVGPLLNTLSHLAYVIYTSGSTGRPKGVAIAHSAVCPLLYWGYDHLKLKSNSRVIQNVPFFFDWSVWEIFITLSQGLALYVTPDEILRHPEKAIHFIRKNDIDVLHVTPTQLRSFADLEVQFGTLKYLLIGGEILHLDLVNRVSPLLNRGCRVFNMYGPTETAIIATTHDIELLNNETYRSLSGIPIGAPVANLALLVLNKYLKVCPVNVSGELYIAFDSLASGYLNDPEKTSEAFIANTLQPAGIEGKRLYKTGDLVRWLSGGCLEFLGRLDHQVKIRGLRIELGEIENHLLKSEKVKAAVVLAKADDNLNKYLCAYVVSDVELSTTELREYLSMRVPDYMIPDDFVQIDEIPLTPNGKVDRKALDLRGQRLRTGAAYVAAESELEKAIAGIWQDVLKIEKVGVYDNFFDLGGNSIKIIQVHDQLEGLYPGVMKIGDLYSNPTIAFQASFIMKKSGEPGIEDHHEFIELDF